MTTLYGRVTNTVSGIFQSIAERTASFDEAIRKNNDNIVAGLRVCMPAKVVSFNPDEMTVKVQLLIREKIKLGGNVDFQDIVEIIDVPVHFPQGGDYVLTVPIKADDEGLVVFADLCIDGWWARGGVQNWMDRRRHDLSDAFYIPGVNAKPNVIQDIALDGIELRKKDNTAKVRVGDNEVLAQYQDSFVKIEANKITLNAATIEFDCQEMIGDASGGAGDITFTASGDIKLNPDGEVKIDNHAYHSHKHDGVTTGSGTTDGVHSGT